MRWFNFISPLILLVLSALLSPAGQFKKCLPEGTKLTDVVSSQTENSGKERKKNTVNDKLVGLKARCKEGKLTDNSGREIRFYRLVGCWGNPPADYEEILERQQKEISELKKQFTVIEIPCASSGALKTIH